MTTPELIAEESLVALAAAEGLRTMWRGANARLK